MVSGASRVGSGAGANQASPTSAAAEKPKEVGRNYLKWNDMVYLVRVLSCAARATRETHEWAGNEKCWCTGTKVWH